MMVGRLSTMGNASLASCFPLSPRPRKLQEEKVCTNVFFKSATFKTSNDVAAPLRVPGAFPCERRLGRHDTPRTTGSPALGSSLPQLKLALPGIVDESARQGGGGALSP